MNIFSRFSAMTVLATTLTLGLTMPAPSLAQDAHFELPEEEAAAPPPQRQEERPERLEEAPQDQPAGWEAQDTGDKAATVAPTDSKNSDSTLRKNFWRRLSD